MARRPGPAPNAVGDMVFMVLSFVVRT
jgi:hypothetical protein